MNVAEVGDKNTKPRYALRSTIQTRRMARAEWVMQQWTEVCRDVNVTAALTEKWGKLIRTKYSEQGRHYHTLDHLADMLEGAERDFNSLRHPSLVRLAIFFHDLVYDPKSGTNEEDSEVLFQRFSKETGLSELQSKTVSEYIIATKRHDVSNSDDTDLRTFTDLDMAVLGRERPGYLKYALQIRSEYLHVPAEIFRQKRAEILREFLTTRHIYATDQYRRDREARARANIEAEIALLDAGDLSALERQSEAPS